MKLGLRLLVPTLMLSIPAGLPRSAWAQTPSDVLADIKGLECRKGEGGVRVSYRVKGAVGSEVRSSLEDGITVRFVHKLTVVRRRALLPNKVLARKTIEAAATLDTLTKQFALTRKIDDVMAGTATTDRPDEVERWLSEVHDVLIPLPEKSDRGPIELKVNTVYQTNYFVLWVLPWPLSAKGDEECR